MKGLAFFHHSSISIASEENLCRERRDWHAFYNGANCLRLPHSVKCLLCCFHYSTGNRRSGRPHCRTEMLSVIYSTQAEIPVGDYWFPVFTSSRRQTPGTKLTLQQFFQSGFTS